MTPLNLKGLSIWADYRVFGDPLQQGMDAFISGAVSSNHEIFRHDFQRMKVKPCQDCGGCYQKEVACAFLDDFNLLAPDLLLSQDLVIFAEGSFSTALKNALSKNVCFEKAPKELDLHKVYLVYEGTEKDLQNEIHPLFEGVFALGPETTKVVRYDKITKKEIAALERLGAEF
jgi:hypothetical protein